MIGWLLKKALPPRNSGVQTGENDRSVPSQTCALWHDVNRALDQSPRPSGGQRRIKSASAPRGAK